MSDVASRLVLVLAGEKRERLGVLGQPRTASALPFGGKFRVIDFTLSNCAHSGLSRVGILTQYAPLSLNAHIGIGRAWDLDRREAGLLLLQPYVRQRETNWYRGTADALVQNRNVIADVQPLQILILSGELVGKMDYASLVERHEDRGSALTIVTLPGASIDPEGVVWVEVDDRSRVRSISTTPRTGTVPTASIYVLQGRMLRDRLDRPGLGPDLVEDVVRPMIAEGLPVHAEAFDGYLRPIRTLEAYYESNMDLLRPVPPLQLHDPDWLIYTPSEDRAPTVLGPESDVTGSVLAHGSRIEGTVRGSILFPGVRIEKGAHVEDSVLMHDVRVGAGARVVRSIMDKHVRIGAEAVIGGPQSTPAHDTHAARGMLCVVGKSSEIPSHARLRPGATVDVEVRETDFPSLEVGADQVIRPKGGRGRWPG